MKRNILSILFLISFLQIRAQQLAWVVTNGGSGEDYGYQTAYSPDNTIVAYGSISDNPDFDPGPTVVPVMGKHSFLAKYSLSGDLLWVNFFDNIPGSFLDVDQEGNIIIAGGFYGFQDFDPGIQTHSLTAPMNWDAFIAKYSADGQFIWVKQLSGDQYETITAIQIDRDNDILIAGRLTGQIDIDPGMDTFLLSSTVGSNPFLLKLNPDGQFIWAGRMDSGIWAHIDQLGIDDANNIYGVGYYEDFIDVDMGPDVVLLDDLASPRNGFSFKYSSSGKLIWANDFVFSGDDNGSLGTIAVTPDGTSWVAGRFVGEVDADPGPGVNLFTSNGSSTDILLLHFDPQGELMDAFQIGGPGADSERRVLIDKENHVYLAGAYQNTVDFNPGSGDYSFTSVNGSDMFVARFGIDGQPDWVASMGGLKSEDPQDLALDEHGNCYLTGAFNGTTDFDPGPEEFLLTSKPGVGTGCDYFLMRMNDQLSSDSSFPSPQQIRIVPNPVTDLIHISGVSDMQSVRIVTQQGVPVYTGTASLIEVGQLPAGMYHVLVQTSRDLQSFKVFKL